MGDGLEGNFREEGLPSCVQSKLECLHVFRGHNFHCQFVPLRDILNAERMLAATGLTPLLVNLESVTSKPNAGGDSKDCVTWKVEEPCIMLYMQIRSARILLRTRENSCSRCRAVSYGT